MISQGGEMYYSRAELERWVARVDDHSRARADRVESRLNEDDDLRSRVLAKPDHRERIFAALATGEIGYLRDRQRQLVSWIEDNPPHLWLSTSPTVIVDLDDRTADLHAFQRKYGCSPQQFARLIRHRGHDRPGPVLVNLRADDLSRYVTGGVSQLVGCVLAEVEHHPERFYRLQHVRAAAFRLMGVNWSELSARAAWAGQGYRKLHSALLAERSEAGYEVTRDAQWPVPNQFEGRIAYYLAVRDLAARHGGPLLDDPILDDWLQGGGDGVLEVMKVGGQLKDRMSRLYLHHHLLSAPLTGALGGDYAMLAREVDHASKTLIDKNVFTHALGAAAEGGRVGLATWMFRQQAGMDPRPGQTPQHVGKAPVSRYPDDDEFGQFLNRVDHNRVAILANRGEVLDEMNQVVERIAKRRRRAPRPLDVEEEIALFRDMVAIGAKDGCQIPATVLAAAGMAAAVATVATGSDTPTGVAAVSLAVGNFCTVIEKAKGVLSNHSWGEPIAERLDRLGNGLCKKRLDRVRIDRFVGTLRV
ncbi:hypothetical protein CA234_21330 [Sphingomonas sp. ABOLE]|nr:hypothetical protein CA234_21330 [Sphingomonas sp. ABOLE]